MTGSLILVIDDEDMVRETMADILAEADLQVLQAAEGRVGIQFFHQYMQEIKLVLLNLSMPNMNGEEVFYELRKISTSIPVVLVTGYGECDVMDRFMNKGLADFIHKPYDGKRLLQQVQIYLNGN